jgi:hypothetical protein
MKYLIFILLPILSYTQPRVSGQDSIVYEKRDSVWYKVTYTEEGTRKARIEDEYTTVDSLIGKTLKEEIRQAALQYNDFKKRMEEQEKSYLLRLRQADRQYRALYSKRPDLDTLSNAKQLVGNWLLDGVEINITKQLKLLTANINFVSQDVFWVNGREYFFKRGDDWISDKRKLIKVNKKLNK